MEAIESHEGVQLEFSVMVEFCRCVKCWTVIESGVESRCWICGCERLVEVECQS